CFNNQRLYSFRITSVRLTLVVQYPSMLPDRNANNGDNTSVTSPVLLVSLIRARHRLPSEYPSTEPTKNKHPNRPTDASSHERKCNYYTPSMQVTVTITSPE